MDNKLALAKILGEIYRTQKRLDNACYVSDSTIFGLLNGVERIIDEAFENSETITREEERLMSNILNEYYSNQEKLQNFNGFYDIEDDLEAVGIDRSKAIAILTLFNAEKRFREVIKKMDSSGSPTECRTFELNEWDC